MVLNCLAFVKRDDDQLCVGDSFCCRNEAAARSCIPWHEVESSSLQIVNKFCLGKLSQR